MNTANKALLHFVVVSEKRLFSFIESSWKNKKLIVRDMSTGPQHRVEFVT
jgi:hypothetical protein